MRQLLQDVSSGEISVADVPAPARGRNSLLVAARCSVISPGTERAVMELGKRSLAGKARARPDLVRKVVETARAEGVASTLSKVRSRLNEPNALGYSLAGVVLEACDDAPAAPGELVACAGAGHAVHAEVVSVPRNLCVRVPDGVAAEDAAYATVATIALHGVRLAEVELGSVVGVVGLGLVGQLTMQLVAAAGAVPLGLDPDGGRVRVAAEQGFYATADPAALDTEARRLTGGRGADAVIVAAASSGRGPLETAAAVARERAVLSLVGDVPVEIDRATLFAKELRLVVSRSYGPGRYDAQYEERGTDYPAAYVRWTEGRNLEEVVRLMAAGKLAPSRLTTHTFDVADGAAAYELLESDEPSMGILLRYPQRDEAPARTVGSAAPRRAGSDRPRIGVIGAGSFARGVLLPAIAGGADIVAVANATGVSASAAAKQFSVPVATTDPDELLADEAIDAVVVATRHDTHADYAERALAAGKSVFVEKPLALDREGLDRVIGAAERSSGVLMVGFNRRFAPHAVALRDEIATGGPLVASISVNAGSIPRDHWTQDPVEGGGRIVGEACHFVDLAAFLAGSAPAGVLSASGVGGATDPLEDNFCATLRFETGSLAVLIYTAFGDPSLPKERIELRSESGAGVIEDFRVLHLHRAGRAKKRSGRRDKGHASEIAAFLTACRSGEQPWPLKDMAAVMRTSFDLRDAVAGPR